MTTGAEADKVLTTDASGVASWTTAAAGATPAGSTGYIQFNDAGALGADSGFFWDNTNKRLGIGTSTPAQKLSVVGTIESTSGGFKFPNGSLQTQAATVTTLICTTRTGVQYKSCTTLCLENSEVCVSVHRGASSVNMSCETNISLGPPIDTCRCCKVS